MRSYSTRRPSPRLVKRLRATWRIVDHGGPIDVPFFASQ
jgi:hypothetical protein